MKQRLIFDLFAADAAPDAPWDFWTVDPQGAMRYFRLRDNADCHFTDLLGDREGGFVDWALLCPLWQPVTVYGDDGSFGTGRGGFSGAVFLDFTGSCPGRSAPFRDRYAATACRELAPQSGRLHTRAEVCGASTPEKVVYDLLAWQAECPGLDITVRAVYPHLDDALVCAIRLSPAGLTLALDPPNTRYALWRRAARALAGPNADALYDYILHGMDDDGDFLRTRHQRWPEVLPDRRLHSIPVLVMATLETPFNFARDTKYYDSKGRPRLRMQLFAIPMGGSFLPDAAWATEGEYPHILIREI